MTQPNPIMMHNTTYNNNEEAQTNKIVPAEIAQLLESNSSTLDSDDANLVQQILPGMVDDNNQPLPENIPTPAEEGQDAPQFVSTWEHSGSCYHCIARGYKHKACLSFNTDVKPTIQQLFEMFFFKPYVVGSIIPQTNICLQEEKHCHVSYREFLCWLGLWFLMATINGPECMDFWSMGEVDCFVGAPMRLGTGGCDSWKGTMEEVPFQVYAMKEPDYVMSLMSTYGTNQHSGKETTHEWVDGSGNSKKTKFNYPEVVGNHFLYCHSIDDHNNKQHSPISLEVVWAMKYWLSS